MSRESECELVRTGEIKHIPKDHKDNGRPNCLGYIDNFRDTELEECKRCPWLWLKDGDTNATSRLS